MTDPHIELDLRREALRIAVRGARNSVPLLWLATAILLPPALDFPLAWPVWLVGGLSLISGLWRLYFIRRLGPTRAFAEERQVQSAEWQIQANAALSGLMWSLATWVLVPVLSPERIALHLAVLMGATAAASFHMSLIGRSFELIAAPVALSLVGVALWTQPPHLLEVTVGTVVFFLAMMQGARHLRRTTLMALRHQLETTLANRALASANERLERDQLARSRFLETMTHEIRRPMSGTIGALDLLAQEPLSPRQQRILEAARHSSGGLMDALSELLEFSALDADTITLPPAPLALADWLVQRTEPHRRAAQAKGLGFALDLDASLPALVQADAPRLAQVLDALLSNAVRFTERGQVRLAWRVAPDGLLLCEVSDTGPGLAQTDLARVFEPFYQVDHGPQRAQTGAGLGLSIVQKLVQAMHGRIQVESTLGRGSRFTVALPLPAAQADAHALEHPPVRDEAPLQGTVLVVDDDEQNRLVAVEMLARGGLQVLEAADGLQALDVLQRGGIGLVLMDGQMPALDGYEATRRWREREERLGTPRVPIIGVSANNAADHERLARHSGMDDHLAKPFGMDELLRRVAPWLERRQAAA